MVKAERIKWMDTARGIGILLVVMGHVERGIVNAGIATETYWLNLDYTLYIFHMPLFFFLSGINAPHGLKTGVRPFLQNKLQTILYPYFLWSIIQGAILISLSSVTNGSTHLSDLLEIGWAPMGQFWFLYVLMLCQILVCIVYRSRFLVIATALIMLALSYIVPPLDSGVPHQLLHSAPFFLAGFALCDPLHQSSPEGRFAPFLTLASGPAFIALTISASLIAYHLPDAPIALPATIAGITLVISMSMMMTGPVQDILGALGVTSMTIFVLHILAAAGLRILLMKTRLIHAAPVYFILCSFAGVAFPYAIHLFLERKGWLPLFGLAKWPRSTPLQAPFDKGKFKRAGQ
ncbi:acyltransferase family protein [Beijerinckia mobilis]|uniref:acyltransferase family protein n=1 Tax=Beijerinckia mobilis TaxID=231434 RepID=UPI000552858D|nr:acyltransferase [Beijerinckia mobilis]